MNSTIEHWVNQWSVDEDSDIYRNINSQVNFFARELYHDYQPTQGQAVSFQDRLENWLLNADDDDDKKTLFKILPHLFYVGNKEFAALYKVAYNELIASWLIDTDNIDFNDLDDAKKQLDQGIRDCWICPITDSMQINAFFHINNIPNNRWNEWRPQWRRIEREGDNEPLWQSYESYITKHNIKKLVILEDFVGSGSQIAGTVEFIMKKNLDLDVLLLPLINCPDGVVRFNNLAENYDRLTYKSVMELPERCFVKETVAVDEPLEFVAFRQLAKKTYLLVSGGIPELDNGKPYSPFGFRKTGGLVVMFTNTPNNTLPMVHWSSNSWFPIFLRHSRN
ncbi:phosphoribosyltransferase-like protein [Parapedobacter sp. 10938]|uniref:phosphoribosyltransferase-like protein n=1 Tax=Parapedobacter flavus TaxID=3110225 RepID=UPI002DB8B665|nr:hypothetical protein [Parapedobacter sp. 10938]MEC3881918.1 hypothetical protein [Parapedobacter sp. 10938]